MYREPYNSNKLPLLSNFCFWPRVVLITWTGFSVFRPWDLTRSPVNSVMRRCVLQIYFGKSFYGVLEMRTKSSTFLFNIVRGVTDINNTSGCCLYDKPKQPRLSVVSVWTQEKLYILKRSWITVVLRSSQLPSTPTPLQDIKICWKLILWNIQSPWFSIRRWTSDSLPLFHMFRRFSSKRIKIDSTSLSRKRPCFGRERCFNILKLCTQFTRLTSCVRQIDVVSYFRPSSQTPVTWIRPGGMSEYWTFWKNYSNYVNE